MLKPNARAISAWGQAVTVLSAFILQVQNSLATIANPVAGAFLVGDSGGALVMKPDQG